MSRKARVHPLTEDEWNDLAKATDEACALALVLDYIGISNDGSALDRRRMLNGCASSLRRILDLLLARLDELEPRFR